MQSKSVEAEQFFRVETLPLRSGTGTMSRRRVYAEAASYGSELTPSFWQLPAAKEAAERALPARSAATAVEAADFHWHLASTDR